MVATGSFATVERRFGSWIALALGGIAFAEIIVPAAAQAQCNSNSNPSPPPAVTANFADRSFSPSTPYPTVGSVGIGGCGGTNGGDDQSGGPGGPGQPGGQVTSTNSSLTLIGAQFNDFNPTTAATIGSTGGGGGLGGTAGNAVFEFAPGGDGGAGGNAGPATVIFNGNFVPDPTQGLADQALVVTAQGGAGGEGGTTSGGGAFGKFAGNGGPGGNGGSLTVTASGSVRAAVQGVTVQSVGGGGGIGGLATSFVDRLTGATGGNGGAGGAGGPAVLQWVGGTVQTGQFGLWSQSIGGAGGDGGQAVDATGLTGGNAGAGGAGRMASVSLADGAITINQLSHQTPGAGILARANGGNGGSGGLAGPSLGSGGGTGGNGGNGGTAIVTVLGSVTYNGAGITGQVDGQGILVQANGGRGGPGGGASGFTGEGGSGGLAGIGGNATLTLGNATSTGAVRTSGNFAHGGLVQSIGGGGGAGAGADFGIGGTGGDGAAGGNGGTVLASAPNASVIATGKNGAALLAQSIGGGGGSGGDATTVDVGASIVIGGVGGLGGDGGAIGLDLTKGVFASTSTLGGAGILAQSIGGSGGAGGSASTTGVGLISMAIGGNSGSGGAGGPVNISSDALITTYGDHAAGIQAQSIGGGGGKGGSAVSFQAGVLPLASVSVGGSGGGGGAAGDVSVGNTAQVTTYGADAHGVLIQSIGGGGGSGGAAAARAVDISPNRRIPAISVAVATGGAGGSGNIGGAVGLNNSGLITTAGDGAIGVMAQSVGGGGGAAGDATAASYAGGNNQGGLSVSIDVAVGGSGGTGGTGGGVTIANSGLIATLGQDAYGVFAQSVGGGGGTGGGGDATAFANQAKLSFGTSVAVGGGGGTGGDAGALGLTNSGAVTTRGDGAVGVFAQSVGGGGGAAGGGTATANGGNIAVAVAVGGKGGAGGNGNTATVQNSGSIVTRGTDAVAIFAQSVGGGGGTGGKGGATAGGVNPVSNAKALFNILAGGLNINQQVTDLGDGILQIGQIGKEIEATIDELQEIFSQPQAGESEIGTSKQIDVSVSVGGSGGAAGNGGAATATNTGSIITFGAQSDGIYAQSVGGGGGSAGAATSTSAATNDKAYQTAIGVGGKGGGGGAGGTVTVVNGTGSMILTQGVAAFGLFAQSVGGGGGEGAAAGTVSGSFKSLSVGVGGSGGTGGNGGAVSVTTGGGTGSNITTTGKHGIAILAQSVGGSGGLARTMTTDQTFDPSKIIVNPQGRLGDIHGLALTFGGQGGVGGDGGQVQVTAAAGPVETSGLDAHAIVAQSVGGGGGIAVGGQVHLQPAPPEGGAGGSGGPVTVQLQSGAAITTAGDGAYGVLAQSVGGSGGIAGDLSAVGTYALGIPRNLVALNSGNGGAVSVTADGALIQTTGKYAPAIFAQSVGGGGGLVNYVANGAHIQARGTAGGAGTGGGVTVSLADTLVFAEGVGSAGILAQSAGTGSGPIQISIDQTSQVRGGAPDGSGQEASERDDAAIRLLGGTGNRIHNAGQILGVNGGIAILADTPSSNTAVTNTDTGRITGDVKLSGGSGSLLDNWSGGVVDAPTAIALGNGGVLRNAGSLLVGGGGRIGRTTLEGDLAQSATGRLVVETNHSTGAADQLDVQGSARLDGTVEVHPVSLANRAVTVLSATEGLTVDPDLEASRTYLYRFDTRQSDNSLQLQPVAEFSAAAGPLGRNQRRVAAHLQRLWDSGATLDEGFTALVGVGDGGSYAQALNSLSGQTVGAIAAFRYSSSHGFVTNMLDECATFEGAGVTQDEVSCAWARAFGGVADQDSTGDALGYHTSAWTLQAGGQREVAPGWFLGGSIGYESSSFRGDAGSSRVSGDSLLLGAILRYQTGPWQASGALDFGYGWYDSRRAVEAGSFRGTADASPNVWHVGAHARLAYQVPVEAWYVQPRLDLHLTYVHSDGYTETGAGPFNLDVEAEGAMTFAAIPAVEVGGRIPIGPTAVLRPFASAGVELNANGDWAATARFADQPGSRGFRAETPIPDVLGRFTLGAELLSSANWDFRLQYSAGVGDGYASHAGLGRVAYRF
ncbi:autotransporter outer membrane beta-barrel domain-containing protein [Inquilinus limosus]|uniref:autotransporter outer membrane beta-barrel domain-containing protein n=1 Tax=Inquilinus limosus TaxID=171674 RepID=UPI0012DF91E2|nr:autotransporter outer membrane beta-barrel domain-containing protein [Inquilinus limosus]